MRRSLRTLVPAVTLLTGLGIVVAPMAAARGDDMRGRGICSDGQTAYKVKARDHHGDVRLDMWVKSGQVGTTWTFAVTEGGATVASGSRVSMADDHAGVDDSSHAAEARFRARLDTATLPLTVTATSGGVTCTTTLGAA